MKEFFKTKWKIIVACVCIAILLAGTVVAIVIFAGDQPEDPPVVPPQTSEGEPNTDDGTETPPATEPVNTFSITLMSDGSEVGKVNDIVEGTTPADVVIPVKDGINYTFLGYFTEENGEGTEIFYADGEYAGEALTEETTAYAYFRPTTEIYTLSETTITGMTDEGKTYSRLSIPSGVTEIIIFGVNSTSLESIIIPSSVTYIDEHAFYECTGLNRLTIPSSVTSIGYCAFCGCRNLTSIVVAEGNEVYDSREGCNAIIETETNRLIRGCKNTIFPSSVTSIGECAFGGCTSLESITIPSSVTSIENEAFLGCTSLESITIPSSVTSIGLSVFDSCSNLTSIVVAEGNEVYDSREGCNAIIETETNRLIRGCKNTIFPSSVTSIGSYAFGGCTSLESITIPSSVTSIGSTIFNGCTNLNSVTFVNSDNWFLSDGETGEKMSEELVLTDPTTNATYLKDTYSKYFWKKNVE